MKEQAESKEARKTKNTFFLHFFPPTLSLSLFKRRRVLSRDRESERERGGRCCCALGAERAAARALPSSLTKMAPPPPLATIGDFSARLAGLTLNSRPLIDALTVSAAEMAATPLGAALVADAVVERAATVRLPRGGGVERRRRREKASNHCAGKAASFFFFPLRRHVFFSPSLLTTSFDPPTFPPPTSPKPTKKQCSPPHRLYALYLLDSLVKNVGEPYGSLFAREARLPRALAPAWAVHPPSRPALRRLVATWDGCVPAAELAEARGWIAEQDELARGSGAGGTAAAAAAAGPLYSPPGTAAPPPLQFQQMQMQQQQMPPPPPPPPPPYGYQQQHYEQQQQQHYQQQMQMQHQQQHQQQPPQQQQQQAPPQQQGSAAEGEKGEGAAAAAAPAAEAKDGEKESAAAGDKDGEAAKGGDAAEGEVAGMNQSYLRAAAPALLG